MNEQQFQELKFAKASSLRWIKAVAALREL
jgi:hypothetical protein